VSFLLFIDLCSVKRQFKNDMIVIKRAFAQEILRITDA